MTRSCVTISLVEEARGGPFVFWDGLEDGCRRAHELGFDAVEVFPPGPDAVDTEQLRSLLDEHQLSLAAVGTGGGWVRQRLVLTSADAGQRQQQGRAEEAEDQLEQGDGCHRSVSAPELRQARPF